MRIRLNLIRDSEHPVICLLDEQRNITQKGGTMRLGSEECHLAEGSLAARHYDTDVIHERHRHRYEFNNAYRQQFEAHGLKFTGLSPDKSLVEIVELPDHPFFMAVQFHPEFKSKPTCAQPLFDGFIAAAVHRKSTRNVADVGGGDVPSDSLKQ